MKHEEVKVGEMIANNIHRVIKSTKDSTRLAFPTSIIQLLYNEARVLISDDEELVEEQHPITAKKIERMVAVNPLQRVRAWRANPQPLQFVLAHSPQQQEGQSTNPQGPHQEQTNWRKMQRSIHQILE
ncbi:hypothetical protein AHAS_Ahas14G0133700 [Arachis hypogaea]